MKRALPLLLSLVLASCAIMPQRERELVDRALDAMGGAVALGNVKSIYMHASMRQWEPEQSYTAGGEMKFAADSRFEVLMDLSADTARVDWARNLVYPTTRSFKFSELVTPGAGYVLGIDSSTRNKST